MRKKTKAPRPVLTPEQKKKRTRNFILIIVILVAATIACYWMMPQSKPLSESQLYDKEEVEDLSRQIVTLVNDEDYDTLSGMVVTDMQEIMNSERMNEGKARVAEDWGEFESIENIQTIEITQRGNHIAAAYVTAKYQNVEVHYTFAFNQDMKLASFGVQ